MPPKGSSRKRKTSSQNSPLTTSKRETLQSNSSGPSRMHLIENARAVSQSEIVSLTYEYAIPEFSLLPKKIGEHLPCHEFYSRSYPNICWGLKIYPIGRSEESINHLGIFLCADFKGKESSNMSVFTWLKVVLLKNGKELVSRQHTEPLKFTANSNWGWEKVQSLDQLQTIDNNQQQEGTLQIFCNLVFEVKRDCITFFGRITENTCTSLGHDQQQVIELNYEWVIEEPFFLPQKNGESFNSPVFFAKTNDKIQWRLKIYPQGVNEEAKGYLSLYLQRVVIGEDDQELVNVKTKWLVTQNKEIFSKSNELQTLGISPLSSSFGWDKVVETDKRVYFDQQLSTDFIDKLKIVCQLVYAI